jgi:hypothetical protein
MNIRPVRAEMFRADGRTDGHDEANSRVFQCSERAQKPINIVWGNNLRLL